LEDARPLPLLRWADSDPTGSGESDTGSHPVVQLRGAHAGTVTGATLACVVDALDAAGIEYFFLQRRRSGSQLGLAAGEVGSRLLGTLRELGVLAPLRVVVEAEESVWEGLARDVPDKVLWSGPVTRIVLYVEVLEPISGLRLGRREGCSLEVWVEDEAGSLHASVPTQHTEEVTAGDRAAPVLLEVGDQHVATVPPFDESEVFTVAFPVDAVVLWVDGSDPDWRAAREGRREEFGLPPDAPGSAERLFADHGELRYLLRSLERYAPWLRHVYLVTAGQRPDWLRCDHPWLTLVDHTDIIESSALPTFSPRPITARMHRIEGLSEHFLYLNDDMVLMRELAPELFFAANGMSKFFLSRSTVPRTPSDLPHFGGRQVIQRLLRQRYDVHVARTFRHAPYAMRRGTLERMHRYFGGHLDATVHRPFRSADDIIPEWMHHYVGFMEGMALPGKISYGYLPIGARRTIQVLERTLTNRRFDTICLNDQGEGELTEAKAVTRILGLLERLLPGHSTFEADGGGGLGNPS
jgi:hypothetical protein